LKIVVDSNIVFSAILNTQSIIGQLLIRGSKHFDFYSISQLKDEINFHKIKIQRLSGFDDMQFNSIYQLLLDQIQFIDDNLLSNLEITIATNLVREIDVNDSLFIALSSQLHSLLWTGDKKLINGLREKNYKGLITTKELNDLFIKFEDESFLS
jgi:predicted nucleic acid-binding protein